MDIVIGELQSLTNAPEVYDYSWAKTIIDNAFVDDRGKVYRLVQHEDKWHVHQQVYRYDSGMNVTFTDQEKLKEHLDFGFLKPTGSPIVIQRKSFRFDNALDWEKQKLENLIQLVESLNGNPDVLLKTRNGGLGYDVEIRGKEVLFEEICQKFMSFC